jgi:hypothetical protein
MFLSKDDPSETVATPDAVADLFFIETESRSAAVNGEDSRDPSKTVSSRSCGTDWNGKAIKNVMK